MKGRFGVFWLVGWLFFPQNDCLVSLHPFSCTKLKVNCHCQLATNMNSMWRIMLTDFVSNS